MFSKSERFNTLYCINRNILLTLFILTIIFSLSLPAFAQDVIIECNLNESGQDPVIEIKLTFNTSMGNANMKLFEVDGSPPDILRKERTTQEESQEKTPPTTPFIEPGTTVLYSFIVNEYFEWDFSHPARVEVIKLDNKKETRIGNQEFPLSK